jgi:SAM-dependent methyltransferase
MSSKPVRPVDLAFSNKYNRSHSEDYYQRHRKGLTKRFSNWLEVQMARKALKLAGNPKSVLDLPCGAGRFWPMLMEKADRTAIGADYSADMIAVAQEAYPDYCAERISCLQTSAFAIDLPDGAVDNILCIRLFHHISEASNRQQALQEFHRVARDTVIISLWVDGNYKAWRRKRLEKRRQEKGQPGSMNRFMVSRKQIEAEFGAAGFDILGHYDMVPFYQMWRVYVLRKR